MKNPKSSKALTTHRLAEEAMGERFLSLQTTDILAIRELPCDPAKINEISEAIDAKMLYDFTKTRLSAAEQEVFKHHYGPMSDLDPSIRGKFDYYLLDAAQQYGAFLFNSSLVRQRLWSWQCGEGGDRKLKSLLDAIYRTVLVRLGKKKGRITRRHKNTKKVWIEEITVLQMRVREALPRTPDAVRQFIHDVIESSPGSFPILKSNKASLMLFLTNDKALAFCGLGTRLRGVADLTPTRFYYEWVAASLGRDPEKVRQDLSAIRSDSQ